MSSSRSAVSSLPTRSVASAGSTHYATFAFARGNLEATVSPNCTPVPGDVTIFQEADYLASLGLTGESDVSPGMIQQSANGCTGTNYTLSWDQLAQLHASNDWEVTVRGNALDAAASPAQQYADSCGLLPGVAAEGFPEASSYYAYNNNSYSASMQSSIVSTCFTFGRRYGSGPTAINPVPVPAPYVAIEVDLNGGACNDPSLACYQYATPARYTLPSRIASLLTSPGWTIIQTYKVVTGSYHSNRVSWDCTGSDPASHWVTQTELYCQADWQTVVNDVAVTSDVVSSAQMAQLQARPLPGPVARLVVSPAAGTVVAGGTVSVSAEGFDAAGDDLGDVTAQTTFTLSPSGSCSGSTCVVGGSGQYTVTGTDGTAEGTVAVSVSPGPLTRLVVSAAGPVAAGGTVGVSAEGFDAAGDDLGDVTAQTTFTMSPSGSCSGSMCTVGGPGSYTVSGTDGTATGAAAEPVDPGPAGQLVGLVVSPATGTVVAGGTVGVSAEGFDAAGNDLGDVTAQTAFTLSPSGSCSGSVCTVGVAGSYLVTGTDGTASGTTLVPVSAGPLTSLVLSPAAGSSVIGGSVSMSAEGFDAAGDDLGDVTAGTAFTVSPSGSCSGSMCTVDGPGTVTVTGTDGTASASVTVNVVGDVPVTFLSAAPTTAMVGGVAYTVSVSGAPTQTPIDVSVDPASALQCVLDPATQQVSFTAVGTCTIDAAQDAGEGYEASTAQQSFTVAPGLQAIAFTSTPPTNAVIGSSTYTVTAIGGASGNTVTLSIDLSSTSVCSISGSTVSFIGAGICTVDANQAASANYSAAPQVQQGFTITAPAQTAPTFTSAAAATAKVGSSFTFAVTTSASPTASISASGLSTWLHLVDNHNGTATMSGIPPAGRGGVQTVTITAKNPAGKATQTFTLTINQAPSITNPGTGTALVGSPYSLAITTSGYPAASISVSSLPTWLSVVDQGNGTATIAGTPPARSGGAHKFTITATNLVRSITQTFTLTVDEAPAVTSKAAATATVGSVFSFTVTTSGYPLATITATGLPTWLSIADHGNGTATLSGTPPAGSGGIGTASITASNAFGSVIQTFSLTVNQRPAVTSPAAATTTLGSAFSFTVTTSGYPLATITATGLPTWLILVNHGDGTATLSGTVPAGAVGTLKFTLTAANKLGKIGQTFTLTVTHPPAGLPTTVVPEPRMQGPLIL